MAEETPELIEQQMQQTREALSAKVTALERQVFGTIDETTAAFNSTVAMVKDVAGSASRLAGEAAHGVRDGVADAIRSADVPGMVDRQPWGMVGTSMMAGLVTGLLLFRPRPEVAPGTGPHAAFTPAPPNPPPPAPAPRLPGWLDAILDRVGEEARKIGEAALASAAASARRVVETEVPKQVQAAAGAAGLNGNGAYPRSPGYSTRTTV